MKKTFEDAKVTVSKKAKEINQNTLPKKTSLNAFNLIDLTIKLDHFKTFPQHEIENLMGEQNSLVQYLIRRLVAHRLYMYPAKFSQKQWISSKLEIKMETIRYLGLKSENKK